jgi:hypothetical protein
MDERAHAAVLGGVDDLREVRFGMCERRLFHGDHLPPMGGESPPVLHAARVHAERELSALAAPRADVPLVPAGLLPAIGPCVRPAPTEVEKLERRIRDWIDPWVYADDHGSGGARTRLAPARRR